MPENKISLAEIHRNTDQSPKIESHEASITHSQTFEYETGVSLSLNLRIPPELLGEHKENISEHINQKFLQFVKHNPSSHNLLLEPKIDPK